MGRAKIVASLCLGAALALPVGALKSQDPDGPAALGLDDPEFAALLARGPEDGDELGTLVMTLLEYGREEDAIRALTDFIWPHGYGAAAATEETTVADCELCAIALATESTRASHAALPALLGAFDEIERRAVEAGDGNPLVGLAALVGDAAGSPFREGRGIWYLYEGFRLGNLSDESKLRAVAFLSGIHWYEEAKALVEQLRDDSSYALRESRELQGWGAYLDSRLSLRQRTGARLLAARDPSAGEPDGEYVPALRVTPVYPSQAAAAGLEGYVVLEFTVDERGRPANLAVVESSDTVFEQAAVEAARQTRYAPRIVGGVPTEVDGVRNMFTFALER